MGRRSKCKKKVFRFATLSAKEACAQKARAKASQGDHEHEHGGCHRQAEHEPEALSSDSEDGSDPQREDKEGQVPAASSSSVDPRGKPAAAAGGCKARGCCSKKPTEFEQKNKPTAAASTSGKSTTDHQQHQRQHPKPFAVIPNCGLPDGQHGKQKCLNPLICDLCYDLSMEHYKKYNIDFDVSISETTETGVKFDCVVKDTSRKMKGTKGIGVTLDEGEEQVLASMFKVKLQDEVAKAKARAAAGAAGAGAAGPSPSPKEEDLGADGAAAAAAGSKPTDFCCGGDECTFAGCSCTCHSEFDSESEDEDDYGCGEGSCSQYCAAHQPECEVCALHASRAEGAKLRGMKDWRPADLSFHGT
jgi:hypothetical protein